MKKAIIIIVAVIIIVGGGYSIYSHATSKAGIETITNKEMSNYQNITKNFINAIEGNNYTSYEKICDTKINSKEEFSKIQNIVKKKLGDFNNITYIETEKQNGMTINFYKGEFSKTTNTIATTFNKDGKIVGFNILPTTTSEKVSEYNKATNTFITAVNTNDYEMYAKVCSAEMGSKKDFSSMQNYFKDKTGNLKSIDYISSTTSDNIAENIYKGTFDKGVMNIRVSINEQGKIVGFRMV